MVDYGYDLSVLVASFSASCKATHIQNNNTVMAGYTNSCVKCGFALSVPVASLSASCKARHGVNDHMN
jgi:hypothetical protein